MIDIIGDIHGYASNLEALLQKMGYTKKDKGYVHPERKVLFLGDYIDRGPEIPKTLEIVKAMVESENAIALMGNHEYNALCYHSQDNNGRYLREHNHKNNHQHAATLEQFKNREQEFENYLEWFKTLPLYYETDDLRAVHACWDNHNIAYLRTLLNNGCLTDELIYQSVKKGTELNDAIDQTLKGKEIQTPKGFVFHDKDNALRTQLRIRWWENPSQMTYKSISVAPIEHLPDVPINLSELQSLDYYQRHEKKVFFGHYWLNGNPSIFKENVCCLDYSVAKGGKLVAYRLNGESELMNKNLIYV